MRLAPLLSALSEDELNRLAVEHVRTDERLPRTQLCSFLENALRSYRFVNDFIINRQPPTFAILTLLLDAPGYQIERSTFRDLATAETRRLVGQIDSGDLVSRDNQLQIYRRAFHEARRNDLDINSSEAALLFVLRRELGIAQVEHFLIEHHQDLREFWDKDNAFEHEENALRSAGVIFVFENMAVLPEEVAPAVRQALGIDMPTDGARRLLSYLSNDELADTLAISGSKTSGTKEVRIDRIVLERIQPHAVLRAVGIATLKDICRETGATVKGSKEELIDRIITHFARGKDQETEEPPPPPKREERRLSQDQFESTFNSLLQQELVDILRRLPDIRQTGTKEVRIQTLWDTHLSEMTLLGELMNRQLEDILQRLGIRLSGPKNVRIERIINYFANAVPPAAVPLPSVLLEVSANEPVTSELEQNQQSFRQKSSNPQASLQPWLERLLCGDGLIRCYATEDPNPPKQLKNKLSQAATAKDGLLVLLLADESAYSRAREALVERWMTNPEWPKDVSCIALAHPLGNPAIHTLIERGPNPWSATIRTHLFPFTEVLKAVGESSAKGLPGAKQCPSCSESNLPVHAKFCSACGAQLQNGNR